MREINELRNIANILADHCASRKSALDYFKNLHPESERVKIMNDILSFGGKPLGVTESRIVLRYLDERHNKRDGWYCVGIKDTENGATMTLQVKRES